MCSYGKPDGESIAYIVLESNHPICLNTPIIKEVFNKNYIKEAGFDRRQKTFAFPAMAAKSVKTSSELRSVLALLQRIGYDGGSRRGLN